MDTGGILMDPVSGDCFELNRVGVQVWLRLAREESPDEVIAALSASYQVTPETLAADLRALMTELERHGLLERRGP
jgi:hypothetical protein